MTEIRDGWAGIADAMALTRRTNATIYRWALLGRVRTKQVGARLFYHVGDLQRYAAHERREP